MFEVTYQEVNKRDEVVTKRKSFKTAAARDKFVERASQKDNFLCRHQDRERPRRVLLAD